jgi:hypothetical protein
MKINKPSMKLINRRAWKLTGETNGQRNYEIARSAMVLMVQAGVTAEDVVAKPDELLRQLIAEANFT